MKRVLKYAIPYNTDPCEVELPARAELLSVGVQRGSPMLWALVDDEERVVRRKLVILATGENAEDFLPLDRYVGQLSTGALQFVFHVFDAGEVA